MNREHDCSDPDCPECEDLACPESPYRFKPFDVALDDAGFPETPESAAFEKRYGLNPMMMVAGLAHLDDAIQSLGLALDALRVNKFAEHVLTNAGTYLRNVRASMKPILEDAKKVMTS